MAGPLVVCPTCSTHVLVRESSCPHCGAKVRSGGRLIGRTAGACLMGLSLAGCPAGDDTSDTMAGSGSTSTQGSTGMPGSTTDDGTTSFDVSSGPVGEAYGAPDTETFGTDPTDSTSTGGDTDTGSSSGGDTDTEGTTGSGSSSSTSG